MRTQEEQKLAALGISTLREAHLRKLGSASNRRALQSRACSLPPLSAQPAVESEASQRQGGLPPIRADLDSLNMAPQ